MEKTGLILLGPGGYFMKRVLSSVFLLAMLCGCAQMCEFGQGSDSSGLKCQRMYAKAEVGMTKKEVEERLGTPQTRNVDVTYRGKTYDEVWVYHTSPPTVLYFKNGVLEQKEYQQ